MPGPGARRRFAYALVLAVAALTRFWSLGEPHAVVFDEVHYLRFTGYYATGRYFVDGHPPLGRLLLVAEARVLGVPAGALAEPRPVPSMRILPALAGTIAIAAVTWVLLLLGASHGVALLVAGLLTLDNALLLVSRLVLVDSLLLAATWLALGCYLAASRAQGRLARWAAIGASATLAGAAVSIKWSGLAALGLVGLAWLRTVFVRRNEWRRRAGEVAVITSLSAAVYLGSFAIHFALLPRSGPGNSFMSAAFQRTLADNPAYDAAASLSLVRKTVELNRVMADVQQRLAVPHPGASPWWSWPVQKHPMRFWDGGVAPDGRQRNLWMIGNTVVWYGTVLALLAVAGGLLFRDVRARLAARRDPLLLLGAGYLANFLPFAAIGRTMFLYHYLVALTFLVAFVVLAADTALPSNGARRWLAVAVSTFAFAAFWYHAPLTYGWPLGASATRDRLRLMRQRLSVESP